MLNNLPVVQDTETIHTGFFNIRCDRLRIRGKDEYDYFTLVARPFAVMVLATTPEGKYVINREYRHPVNQILLSCPGGVLDDGEAPLDCAARELAEETGYSAEHFEILGETFPFPGVTNQKSIFVRATNAKKTGETSLEYTEFIETDLYTKEEIWKKIHAGEPTDGILCTALFLDQAK